jgi:hypothetical protein
MKSKAIKLSEFGAMSEHERNCALDELVTAARAPRNGQALGIVARIEAYEKQYGMTSAEMRAQFRAGNFDNADVSRWLMLLRLQDPPAISPR